MIPNYQNILYSVAVLICILIITKIVEVTTIKVQEKAGPIINKKVKKRIKGKVKSVFNILYIIIIGVWGIGTVLLLFLNPVIDSSEQTELQTAMEEKTQITMPEIRSAIKKKNNEPIVELRMLNKQSQEDYEVFLNKQKEK